MLNIRSFYLDLHNEQLWCGQQEVRHLSRKALEVLRHLVTHPGQLVTKEAFMDAVWPET